MVCSSSSSTAPLLLRMSEMEPFVGDHSSPGCLQAEEMICTVYLCTGAVGPVFPHELAEQARNGIAVRATADVSARVGGHAEERAGEVVYEARITRRNAATAPKNPARAVRRPTATVVDPPAAPAPASADEALAAELRVKRERDQVEEADAVEEEEEGEEEEDSEIDPEYRQAVRTATAAFAPEPYGYPARAEENYFKRRRTHEHNAHAYEYEEDYAPHPNRHYIPSRHAGL